MRVPGHPNIDRTSSVLLEKVVQKVFKNMCVFDESKITRVVVFDQVVNLI